MQHPLLAHQEITCRPKVKSGVGPLNLQAEAREDQEFKTLFRGRQDSWRPLHKSQGVTQSLYLSYHALLLCEIRISTWLGPVRILFDNR